MFCAVGHRICLLYFTSCLWQVSSPVRAPVSKACAVCPCWVSVTYWWFPRWVAWELRTQHSKRANLPPCVFFSPQMSRYLRYEPTYLGTFCFTTQSPPHSEQSEDNSSIHGSLMGEPSNYIRTVTFSNSWNVLEDVGSLEFWVVSSLPEPWWFLRVFWGKFACHCLSIISAKQWQPRGFSQVAPFRRPLASSVNCPRCAPCCCRCTPSAAWAFVAAVFCGWRCGIAKQLRLLQWYGDNI